MSYSAVDVERNVHSFGYVVTDSLHIQGQEYREYIDTHYYNNSVYFQNKTSSVYLSTDKNTLHNVILPNQTCIPVISYNKTPDSISLNINNPSITEQVTNSYYNYGPLFFKKQNHSSPGVVNWQFNVK